MIDRIGIFIYVKVCILTVVMSVPSLLMAQNEVLFSHFSFNQTYYNPAWNGTSRTASFNTLIRSQWTGYSTSFDGSGGAPFTQMASLVIPAKSKYINSAGAFIINDQVGPVNTFQMLLPVSAEFPVRTGMWTLGASVGLVSQSLRFDKLRFVDPSDPYNSGTREVQTRFLSNVGIQHSWLNGSYMALSVVNLNQPAFDYGVDSLQSIFNRTVNVAGGVSKVINTNLSLRSNLLVRSDLITATFDVNTIVFIQEKMWAGLGYRYQEATNFLIGYSFLTDGKLKVGYSLDYILNERKAKQLTSQEIFLSYQLPDLILGGKKQIKTPRFAY